MKIPKKLKVGGLIWEIAEDNNVAEEGQCFASTHPYTQKFFIDPKISQQKKEQSLIHEILHAVWWTNGIRSRKELSDHEEFIVDSLSQGLYQVLKDAKLLK